MGIEEKLKQMGIELPDFGPQTYYGATYGKMKPFHRIGSLLVLSGHVPDLPDGTAMFPGRIGAEVTVEQGYAAARQTAINCLAGIKQAIGDLDRVVALVRTLNFVVCAPGFTDRLERSDRSLRRLIWSGTRDRLPRHDRRHVVGQESLLRDLDGRGVPLTRPLSYGR
jgi:enamine deaminase RidA (YjgF/YER057c/UK114 family)